MHARSMFLGTTRYNKITRYFDAVPEIWETHRNLHSLESQRAPRDSQLEKIRPVMGLESTKSICSVSHRWWPMGPHLLVSRGDAQSQAPTPEQQLRCHRSWSKGHHDAVVALKGASLLSSIVTSKTVNIHT